MNLTQPIHWCREWFPAFVRCAGMSVSDFLDRRRDTRMVVILLFLGGFLPCPISGQTNPQPRLVGEWPGFARGFAVRVAVVDSYAYVAQQEGGVGIYDVSNPANIVRLGGFHSHGLTEAVQINGTIAYAVGWNMGLQILDVSNPARVKLLDEFQTLSNLTRIRVEGSLVYAAGNGSALHVFDVTDPDKIVRLGSFTNGYPVDFQISGTIAYAANSSLGSRSSM